MSKFNLGSLLKNAKKMQEMMQEAQKKLEHTEVFGESGAGAIKITMSGRYSVKKVDISDEILKENKDIVEDLIAAAINDATQKVEALTKSQMTDASEMFGDISDE